MRTTAIVTLVATSALLLPQVTRAAATTTPRINGWYPCTDSMPHKATLAPGAKPPAFECAQVEVPLCHVGVCTSTKTINLFVKRILAAKPTKPRKAMWFLQGGPGIASAGMEHEMKLFSASTHETVDMYTVDHRGVGRSNYLECQAAQAFAAGSPGGIGLDFTEIPNCVRDIMFQIDNKTEAFSVTSAAKDVVLLLDVLHTNEATDVFLYGGSYGTYWGSRVLHLAPPQVRGYILDGVVDEKAATFTTWNQNRRLPEARFLQLCATNAVCKTKLAPAIEAHGTLSNALQALYKRLDAAPRGKDACADLVRRLQPEAARPSWTLRSYLGRNVQSDPTRVVVPALIHRFVRCAPRDVTFLTQLLVPTHPTGTTMTTPLAFAASVPPLPTTKDRVMSGSDFLGSLIKASEMWTTPSPTWRDEVAAFDAGLFSTSISYDYALVCFLRGNLKDPMCSGLIANSPHINFTALTTPPYVYKPDLYWHKYASIPRNASVLVITSGLDFQTPQEWGTAEFNGLQGGDKMLVNFETGVHCAGISKQTASDTSQCGMRVIGSYVLGGGRVDRVNTTCIDMLPALDFADISAIQHAVGTGVKTVDELYG